MKRLFISILLPGALFAAEARNWTLDECIAYALEHNITVQQRQLSAYEGELSVTEAKDRFLPQLGAYGSQNFNFGRALTADNTYANRNTTSTSFGAQMSLPLFQGLAAVRRLEYSRTQLKALLEEVESAKDDVTLNVIGQYLQVLYAAEMLDVANERLAISTAELDRRHRLLDAGRIPELDIYEAQAQVSQDELSVVNASNDRSLALLDLSQLLNLPSPEDFDIAPLPDQEMPLLAPDEVFQRALTTNHAIRAQQLLSEASDKNVDVARSGYIPTLSFSAGLGTNYYKTTGYRNESFGQQMRHNFSKSLGFSLSVPIFDAFGTRNNIRRAKAYSISARLQLDDSRLKLYKSITQAYTQAVGAQKKKEAAQVAVERTRAAFEAVKVKFDNGRATPTEFDTAKANYTNAMAEAVQAKYENLLRLRILAFYAR